MEVYARNAPEALYEMMCCLKVAGVDEYSRNGPVLTIPDPVMLTVERPTERVLLDPVRDANPFFHVAETVWMLGGGQGVEFPAFFNSGMTRYSDDGATFHGAYGHRWRKHFYRDQLVDVIALLREDPSTRRAVVAMWDAEVDARESLDVPCNTHVVFRVQHGTRNLDMTVFNRSNDVVWGMCGANIVHMTYLHELIAYGAGLRMGVYRVLTNNAHLYTALPVASALLASTGAVDTYRHYGLRPYPLLHPDESYKVFLNTCARAVAFPWEAKYNSVWLNNVYVPMRDAYKLRKEGHSYVHHLNAIKATDWKAAATQWCQRRGELV